MDVRVAMVARTLRRVARAARINSAGGIGVIMIVVFMSMDVVAQMHGVLRLAFHGITNTGGGREGGIERYQQGKKEGDDRTHQRILSKFNIEPDIRSATKT